MSKDQKRIDQLKLELQVAVDEFNKIQDKLKELSLAREALKMKAFSCSERLKELQGQEEIATEIQTEPVN
jgi:flagellar biosynthesis chaperone FliJ